jgi:hypothetical protein
MRLVQALLLSLACSGAAWSQPRAVLDAERFDFGRILQGAQVVHRFVLANGGDEPLEVQRVVPSCGCTTAVLGRTLLAPGERTELEVAFASAGFQGPVHKTVEVDTNDPAQPRRTLDLQADVQAQILLASNQVSILDLAPGDRRHLTVKLESGTGQPITVADVELSPAPWLGVATRETGQTLFVDLDVLARRLPRDRIAGTDTITLRLANPRPATVTLQVNWAKVPPISATPARVAWAEPAGRDLAATVTVRSRDRKPFRILAARTTQPLLEVKDLRPGAAASHPVRVTLKGSAGPGSYDEQVVLELDVPGQQQLEFRVAAVLR